MSDEDQVSAPSLRLPDWLERIVDPQVLQSLRENKDGFRFSWYEPLFLKNASPAAPLSPQQLVRQRVSQSWHTKSSDDTSNDVSVNSRDGRHGIDASNKDSGNTGLIEHTTDEDELAKEQRRARVVASSSDGLFPELTRMVLSDAFDGVLDVHEDERSVRAELQRRQAALGLNWEQPETLDEIWNGPPLSDKVPPAEDYERLLLDS